MVDWQFRRSLQDISLLLDEGADIAISSSSAIFTLQRSSGYGASFTLPFPNIWASAISSVVTTIMIVEMEAIVGSI